MKRGRDDAATAVAAAEPADDDETSSDEEGPQPLAPAAAAAAAVKKKKRRRVLQHEKLFLDDLPSAEMYERSFMHRDVVTQTLVTPRTDFLVTASADGHAHRLSAHLHTRDHLRVCASARESCACICCSVAEESVETTK